MFNFCQCKETCLRAVDAKGAFHYHAGIAYFVKVGPSIQGCQVGADESTAAVTLLDDLFICDACDRSGVPDLMGSFVKHTEGHHLIRCQAPETGGDTSSPMEQRLLSMEDRLNGMQTQLDDLTRRMGDPDGRVRDLTGGMGDLHGLIGDLFNRVGEIERLLQKLAGTVHTAA
jgi:hypothetical protein